MTNKLESNKVYRDREGNEVRLVMGNGHTDKWCNAETPLRPNVAHTGFTYYMANVNRNNYYYGDGLWAGRVYDKLRTDSTVMPGDLVLTPVFQPMQLSLFD